MNDLEFLRPQSVLEASHMMAEYQDEAKLIGAGSAVILMLTQHLIAPRYLVSVAHLPGMNEITYEPGLGLRIGSLVTHYQVESSALVKSKFPVLADTFHKVANIRVRNQGTVGGVVCEADYASDPPATLVALQARIKAVSTRGERWIELTDFYRDFYTTALDHDEIVTEILVPEPSLPYQAIYLKFKTRSTEDRPCVGVAVTVGQKDGLCESLRVVVGAVTGTPQEIRQAESLAAGRVVNEDLARQIGRAYAEAIDPISDVRGSAAYRRQVIEVLVRRAILGAVRLEAAGNEHVY